MRCASAASATTCRRCARGVAWRTSPSSNAFDAAPAILDQPRLKEASMANVVPLPDPPMAEVHGTNDRFPVRRVYCVGRNYAAHAREMGFDPDRDPPFFFCKPADAVVPVAEGATLELPYPAETSNYHYEIELVAAIGKGGSNIALSDALSHVWGYAVGLDMTRRDLQMKMREMGRPWEIGKAFDAS